MARRIVPPTAAVAIPPPAKKSSLASGGSAVKLGAACASWIGWIANIMVANIACTRTDKREEPDDCSRGSTVKAERGVFAILMLA